jgi:hypothetical protein
LEGSIVKNVRTWIFSAASAAALLAWQQAVAAGSTTSSAPSSVGGGGGPSSGPPSGDGAGSGGPGTLGGEVPIDSYNADLAYHSQLRVSGPTDKRIEENLQKFHADNRAAVDMAARSTAQGATTSPEAKAFAQDFAEKRMADDQTVVAAAQSSGFEVGGAAFAAESSSLGGTGSSGANPTLSDVHAAAQQASQTAGELLKDLRSAHRYELASKVEQAKKGIDADLKRWMPLGPPTAGTGG